MGKSVFMGGDEEITKAYISLRDHMIRHYIRQYKRKKLTKKELAVIRKCLYSKINLDVACDIVYTYK